jgi:hypothetical protein
VHSVVIAFEIKVQITNDMNQHLVYAKGFVDYQFIKEKWIASVASRNTTIIAANCLASTGATANVDFDRKGAFHTGNDDTS